MEGGGLLNWDELEPNVQESYLGAEPSIAGRLSSSSSAFVSSSLSSSSSSSRADTNLLFLGLCTKAEKSRAPDGRPNGEEGLRALAPATDSGLSPPEPPAAEPAAPATDPIIVEPNSASLSTQIRLRPEQLIYLSLLLVT